MSYRVELQPHAAKQLRKLPVDVRRLIDTELEKLGSNPRPHGCLKLTGSEQWRIRVRQHRVRYLIDDAARTIKIVAIVQRGAAYDDL